MKNFILTVCRSVLLDLQKVTRGRTRSAYFLGRLIECQRLLELPPELRNRLETRLRWALAGVQVLAALARRVKVGASLETERFESGCAPLLLLVKHEVVLLLARHAAEVVRVEKHLELVMGLAALVNLF